MQVSYNQYRKVILSMIFDIGAANVYLLCFFVLVIITICRRVTFKFGLFVGLIFGILEIVILALLFSKELFTLSNLAILICLFLTSLICSLSASRSREQRNIISGLQEQLNEAKHDVNYNDGKYNILNKKYNVLNEKYNNYINSLSKDKVYRRTWDSLTDNNPDTEKLIGLIITQLHEYDDVLLNCSKILLSLNPNIFAVMNIDGGIIAYNDKLLPLYGYTQKDKIIGNNIISFIQSEDVKKASICVKNIIVSEPFKNESYLVKTESERHTKNIVLPSISFKCTGNPLVIVAYANSSRNKDNHMASKAVPAMQLVDKCMWHINNQDTTTYMSDITAQLLGYSACDIVGRKITDYLFDKNIINYYELRDMCKGGERRTQNFDFIRKDGNNIAIQLDIFPVLSNTGDSLGMVMILNDISERRKIEEALHHRISMEEMITTVSTRFIGIASDKLDDEIENVLNMIGEFTGVKYSYIKLYSNERIGEEREYSTTKTSGDPSGQIRDTSGNNRQLVHKDDTIMIPLTAKGQTLGFFRCTKKGFFEEWLSEDIKLIKLTGEIFVNALARRNYELNLRLSEESLRVTLTSIGDAVIAIDNNKIIFTYNQTAEDLIGLQRDEAIGKYLDDVFITRDVIESENLLNEMHNIVLECTDGQMRYISLNRNYIKDDKQNTHGEVIIFRDITEKKIKDDEIRYISFHDKLTDLYNRAFFEEEISRLDTNRQYPITIIMGDCNGLKLVNDVFGHPEGDRLLKKTAEILKASARKEDIIARWGGDEFVIILPRTEEKTAIEIRERIINACNEAEINPIQPSLALGSATKTDDTQTINDILKEAEERMYRHKLLESKSTRNSIISSFEKMLFERNYETEEHAKRLQDMSKRFGHLVGLSDDELDNLSLLSTLHDIGKIGIPDNILLKPGLLTDGEWELMVRHPEKGYNIAKATNELKDIANLILYHHERWDGSGYPEGLSGTDIPKLSRMLSIMDAYDVITHSRPYKKPLSHKEAMSEITYWAGTQFDPELVEIFSQLMENEIRKGII